MTSIALVCALGDAYDHGVARGVARFAAEHAWQVHGLGWMFRPIPNLRAWRGDGAIARITGTADARRLAQLHVPVIDVAGAVQGWNFTEVTNDDYATGVLAGRQFAGVGFTRVAFAGVSGVRWSAQRLSGLAAGLQQTESTIPTFRRALTWWRRRDTSAQLQGWLKSLPRPAAIFASHDVAGLRIIEACHDAELSVPGDIAVLGCDDERIACELSSPPLSSIPADCERIGYQAAAALAELFKNPQAKGLHQRIVPLEPVLRASTATVVIDDGIIVRCLQLMQEPARLAHSVDDLAIALQVSRRALEQRFRAALGESILQRWTVIRLLVARRAIRDGATLEQASIQAGWTNARSLTAVVQRVHGMTPKVWAAQSAP